MAAPSNTPRKPLLTKVYKKINRMNIVRELREKPDKDKPDMFRQQSYLDFVKKEK